MELPTGNIVGLIPIDGDDAKTIIVAAVSTQVGTAGTNGSLLPYTVATLRRGAWTALPSVNLILTRAAALFDEGARAEPSLFLAGAVATVNGVTVNHVVRQGTIDAIDLGILLLQWGTDGAGTLADINGDGVVDNADLALLLGNWGTADCTR